MTRSLNKMATPEGIGAGQTATIKLPLGYTYNTLFIRMADGSGDIAEADWGDNIDEIRLKVDGDDKIQIDAVDLVSLNKYYGISHDDGVLPLFMSRPWMRTILGEETTGFDTVGGMSSFSLEIDLKAGITIDQLNVYAQQSTPVDRVTGQVKGFGAHLRIQKYTHNQGVIGDAEIADIVRSRYSIMAMHLKTANVDRLEVLADNSKFYDTDKAMREAIVKLGGRVPQAGFTHIDFLPDNQIGSAMPMLVNDFRIKAEFTAAGSVPFYIESIQGSQMVGA